MMNEASKGIELHLSQQDGELMLRAETYSLVFPTDRPFVYLLTPQEGRVAEFFVFSSVHPTNGRDETYQIEQWVVQETPDKVEFSIHARSTAWAAKICRFTCFAGRFTYSIDIEGKNNLASVDYFGGYYSGSNKRWGTGFFWSGQQFKQIFNPEPNMPEIFHYPPLANSKIDLTGVPIPAKGDWFFTPPPFCFAAQLPDNWMTLGIEAKPRENNFTEYQYHGTQEAFYLSLDYEGHTAVDGHFQLPAVGFDFAPTEYEAIEMHVRALRKTGLTPIPDRSAVPSWWHTPIFCGWGAQCYLAALDRGHAPDYARQEHYQHFLGVLEQNGLEPGMVVLDDKWQANYGDNLVDTQKWPDLRGFIDEQHRRARHVLLWLKAWDAEGIPAEECIVNAAGVPMAFDPTNPNFEGRLRASVRQMLSSDGYDADGFKIDFTARIPSGPGLKSYDDSIWGVELIRRYLEIIYSEAKTVKPDALVMTHTPHPYLADVLDMIRLNDINVGRDVNRAMLHRAKVARIACPEAIIDTDNWPITDKATWQAYMRIQPEIGVSSLYYATHIDMTGEPLEKEDYDLIRRIWDQERQQSGD